MTDERDGTAPSGTPAPGPPTKPLTEKQQRVLDAALEMFAERGYSGVATNEIAKKAGVAEGTIFKTWKTKKELLVAVVAPLFFRIMAPRLVGEIRALLVRPWPDAESLLRAIFQNRAEFIRDHKSVLKVVLQELPFHPEVRALAAATAKAQLWPEMRAAIERLQAEGKIRSDVEPHVITRNTIAAFIAWFAVRNIIEPGDHWDDAKEQEQLLRLLLDGIHPR
ncbi:MAG: TetR/AcrR family transcriptional regulator [Deltaproteobacteria bacterium]|nr:TetR/AcrR family transcriptional regulator [Deltaproteobacteria bacterium]